MLANKQVDYIYHLGDIHIRPLDRHVEYRDVFNNLYTYLNNEPDIKKSLIVICGDLIHEKDKITPELIILLREFLKNLSLITDVILFSGNHDLIENNLKRTASLEALTQDLDNVFYLKYTGLYEYGPLIFSLNSLEDDKDFIKIPADCDKVKIGLYHGMLKEIAFSNGLLSVNDFKDFDYTLLGDIHIRQYMKDNIAYSGSLIQQNFGESNENHGLIKWDLLNKKSYEIDIKNDYGYVTITDESMEFSELPRNSRIRFNTTRDITELRELIKKNTNIISERIIPTNNFDEKIKYEKEYIENINDEDIIKDNIEDYKPIIELHNEIKKECSFDIDNISENQWSILNLEYKNLFIYGNDIVNKIDFNTKRGVIGILGNNAIGKSTIINIIIFVLYDKISTEYNNANVLNKNSKNMYVKIEFMIGDIHYIIEKSGTIRKRGVSKLPKYTTEFKKYENGNEINLNGKDRIQTQQFIEKTIGKRDIFILCNIVSNVNTMSILNMTNSVVIQMFSNLLNLEKYQDLYKNISLKLKELVVTLNIAEGKYSTYELLFIEDINSKKFTLKNKKHSREHDIEKLKDKSIELENLKEIITELNSKIIIIDKPTEAKSDLITQKDFITQNLKVSTSNSVDSDDVDTLDDLYKKMFNIKYDKESLDTYNKEFKELEESDTEYTIDFLLEQELLLRETIKKLKQFKTEILQYTKIKTDDNTKSNTDDNKYSNLTMTDLEERKNKIKFREIHNKEIVYEVNDDDIVLLKKNISSNENILFFNFNQLSIESNKLKEIIREKHFYDEGKNSYKKDETDIFLNDVEEFLSNIKDIKELDSIKKEITQDKKSLIKLENKSRLNNENILLNKTIDEDSEFNLRSTNKLKKILDVINNTRYIEIENKIKTSELYVMKLENNINNIKESNKYYNLKELIFKMTTNIDIDKDIQQLKYKDELNIINMKLDKYIIFEKVNEQNDIYKNENKEQVFIKDTLENSISVYNTNVVRLETEIKYEEKELLKLDKDYKNKMNIGKEIKEMTITKELYEKYKNLVDKKCIPSILLKEKIEYIKKDINNNLKDLVKFEIDMYISEDLKFTLDIIKNDTILKAYMCSGYERFILNMMIKNSLNRYCYNNKSNLFCIDEGLDCIDDSNLMKFTTVLERLQKTYNHIILISQIDRIDKYVDHQIMIEHKQNSSFIKI